MEKLAWLTCILLLAAGCAADSTRNPQYLEFDPGKWRFSGSGPYTGRADRRDLYDIHHPWVQSVAGSFGQIETSVSIPSNWRPPFALHFYVSPDYISDSYRVHKGAILGMECYIGHRFNQVLIDDKVVWERDVGDRGPAIFAVNITPLVKPGASFRLALRVIDKVGTDVTLPGDFKLVGPLEGEQDPSGPRKFRTNVWWGDVAIRDRDDASKPMPPRVIPSEKRIIAHKKTDFPLPPLSWPHEGSIKLPVDVSDRLPSSGFPITCGVPIGYGKVKDVSSIELIDSRGQPVPLQRAALSRWGDGSIRWALLDLVALPGRGPYTLQTHSGTVSQPTASPIVSHAGNTVKIDSRLLAVEMGGDRYALIDSITIPGSDKPMCRSIAGRLVTRDGEAFRACPDAVKVIEQGPIRATVEARGKLVGDKRNAGRFVFRVSAYAGTTLLRTTFRVFNESGQSLKLGDLVLSVPTSLQGEPEITWGDVGKVCKASGADGFELDQFSPEAWSARDSAGQSQTGKRAVGWFGLSGGVDAVTVGARDFWQQFPKSFAIRDGAIEIGLCASGEGAPVYEQKEGEAKRHEVWFDFGSVRSDPEKIAACMLEPPRLFAADWFCASGALGPAYPCSAEHFKSLCDLMAGYGDVAPEKLGISYGIKSFGDSRWGSVENDGWCNNYYDRAQGMLAGYLPSGDRRWFDRAEETILHSMDVDQCHHDDKNPRNVGGIYATEAPGHSYPGQPPDKGPWTLRTLRHGSSFAAYYWLTGDPDAREALVMLADWLVREKLGEGEGLSTRDYAAVGVSLAWAYEVTGDGRYTTELKRMLEVVRRETTGIHGGSTYDRRRGVHSKTHGSYNYRGNAPWLVPQLAEPFYMYYRATGDPDAAKTVLGLSESVLSENMDPDTPGDFYGYSSHPMFGKTSNYNCIIAPLLMYGCDLTGDRAFFDCAKAAWNRTIKDRTVSGVHNVYWLVPTLLYFLHMGGAN